MRTTLLKRSRLTEAERRKLVEEYRQSGLTQREFAAAACIGLSTLCTWLRRDGANQRSGGAQFVSLPNFGAAVAATPSYRLELSGRMTVEIPAGFRSEDLRRLMEVLRSL